MMTVFVGSACADVKGFNAAMAAKDYPLAATEALDAWQTLDKTKPATATIAREFGYASYLGGNLEAAEVFSDFLVAEGATLPTPDDQPLTANVLAAVIDMRQQPNEETRNALFAALEERKAAPQIDHITAKALEYMYQWDWRNYNLKNSMANVPLANELLDRAGGALLLQSLDVGQIESVTMFLDQPIDKDYVRLVDFYNRTVNEFNEAGTPELQKQIAQKMYLARAWALAAYTYFNSSKVQTGSNIPQRLKRTNWAQPEHTIYPGDPVPAGMELCETKISTGNFQYPASARFKGFVGAVIVKLDFDLNGDSTNAELIAAVPAAVFGDHVVASKDKFKLRAPKSEGSPKCFVQRKDRLFTVLFVVG